MGIDLAARRLGLAARQLGKGIAERYKVAMDALEAETYGAEELAADLNANALQTFNVAATSLYLFRSPNEPPVVRRARRASALSGSKTIQASPVLEKPLPTGITLTNVGPELDGNPAEKLSLTATPSGTLNDEVAIAIGKNTSDPPVTGTYRGEVRNGTEVIVKVVIQVVP